MKKLKMILQLILAKKSWVLLIEGDDNYLCAINVKTNLVGTQELLTALQNVTKSVSEQTEVMAAEMGELRALRELKDIAEKKIRKSKA